MIPTLFYITFGVGVGFIIFSFILGEFGADFDGLPFLRPSIAAAFLVIFGGAGWLAQVAGLSNILSIWVGFFAGLFVSLVFHRFVIVPLRGLESTSAADRQAIIGLEATVIERIPQGGFGKISFTINGNKHNAPAKSDTGEQIERLEQAQIIYIENSIYFVRGVKPAGL